MTTDIAYAPDDAGLPPLLYPEYRSTGLRSPRHPLVNAPQTLTEVSGPSGCWSALMGQAEVDLTSQHGSAPHGQRIRISGRVLDDSGRPVPNTIVEIWQANAAGRYIHRNDNWDAPLDPNFTGAGRVITDDQGWYSFTTIRPGAYPWGNHHNAWRPAHIHLSLLGPAFATRLVTQIYFPDDPLIEIDPIANAVPMPYRNRLICRFDIDTTIANWALGYRFDIVLKGAMQTPFEGTANG
ncbi:protocatechuate 3,4-dioxygenase subunit beta [Sphingobium sp. WTD-1]|uniref:protocatechuate 3,4-dioxygenase subunit beta n=1 Tax=Pseudomonadota TaxID=1224 RepID=UPI0012BB1E14|nr:MULTISPECIES: protocatechuate 3,4-dioxygenase subunit beta [Pseudomonadota]MCE4542293.1 protocatechuate 3,4-dioxygenase subunit beta [Caballeronia sp. PC1]MCE4544762.1 protocatechuate 3,4-dioxygenase subunit beta [Caballeronia sp. PC1]MCE4545032.1 protocatechuate 3,4-dioxygenase subunit beta [Caballeronia sp. PC1]QGP77761.1 protocatechuate 3,4-dioxygenase subunit beta [Sphingobium sp. CAP-1]QKR98449.1 protocatechuate 3,4-dioxygenase subunit beta [Sphingomonas sp. CL5.1]